MFDEHFQLSPNVVSCVLPVVALISADTISTPLSTSIDQDAPYASTSPTSHETQSPVISKGAEEQLQPAQFDNDPFKNVFTLKPSYVKSSSRDVITANLQPANP
nr:hypothetical protein [Tanacetum cinerariifolium]GEV35039.1 hypothetical protein [Tanacetum cinerariifolium]